MLASLLNGINIFKARHKVDTICMSEGQKKKCSLTETIIFCAAASDVF